MRVPYPQDCIKPSSCCNNTPNHAPRKRPSYSTSQIIGMGLNAPFNNAEPLYLQEGKQTYVFNAMRLLAYWLISQPLWFALIWLKERNRHLLLRQQALAHLPHQRIMALCAAHHMVTAGHGRI